MKILIITHGQSVSTDAIGLLLRKNSHEVIIKPAVDFSESLAEFNPDLIILGYTQHTTIKERMRLAKVINAQKNNVPIVFICGETEVYSNNMIDELERTINLIGFFICPVAPGALLQTIRKLEKGG